MPTEPSSATPRPRQAILREVYEANRRLTGQAGPEPVPAVRTAQERPRNRLRWLLATPLVVAAVALAAWDRPLATAPRTVASAAATPAASPAPTGDVDVMQAPTSPPSEEDGRPSFGPRVSEAATSRDFLASLPDDLTLPPVAQLATAPPAWRGPIRRTAPRRAAAVGEPATETATSSDLAIYTGPDLAQGMTLKDIFGLGVRTIVIDPGHGGRDPGTSGKLGTHEKDVTLDVALRLKALLEHDQSFRVLLTREDDTSTPLSRRVELANASAVDLFISIHVNYLANSTLNVIETYYFGAHSDPDALRLAEHENHGSDYGMSDFESLVRNMRDTIKLQESKRLATAIQASLTTNMQRTHRELLDVGTKTAPFVVLLGVKAPAVLAEISCMCNPEAEQRLRTPGHREEIARFIAEGIVNYLNETAIKGDETNDRQRQAKKS